MCKHISSPMVIGYALKNRDSVSNEELMQLRHRLVSCGEGFLADVSFHSIRRVVSDYGDSLELVITGETYQVRKKSKCAESRLFRESHLKACYGSSYRDAEYQEIVSILIGQ